MTMSDELPPGSRIDRYIIDSVLGSGGMGTVYRARHAHMGNAVALKVLRAGAASDGNAVERFLNEAKASATSGTPHIVRVLDFGLVEGTAFLVMELLEGRELWAMMRETGPLPPPRAVAITLEVLAGVGAAHAAGIVHRDLKPQNVFLAKQPDGSEVAKLLDFGISKIIEGASVEHLTRTGVLLGTPMYMAPEQFLGSRAIDRRADLYSVSVMLYEMLSRSLPHEADTLSQLVVAVTSGTPTPLWEAQPDVPRALADIVHRGLERDPERRWQNAQELSTALRGYLQSAGHAAASSPMSAASSSPMSAASSSPMSGASPSPMSAASSSPMSAASSSPMSAASPSPMSGASTSPMSAASSSPMSGASASPTSPRAPSPAAPAAALAETHVAWTSGAPPGVALGGRPPPAAFQVLGAGPPAAPAFGGPPVGAASRGAQTDNTLRNVIIGVALLLVLGCLGSCVGCYALQLVAATTQ